MCDSFRLGEWLVEPTLNRISQNGASRHLEPKVMQVLVCLSKAEGQLVSKQQIIDEVWKATFVTDDVLTRSISELRDAFGDDARDPTIIQTIPKAGYRLLADVREVEPVPPHAGVRSIFGAKWWQAGTLVVMVVIALTAYVIVGSRTGSPRQVATDDRPPLKATRLTHSGSVAPVEGAEHISPDGKLLFYVHRENGRCSIRMRQLSSGSELTVLQPTEKEIYGITVTPQGDQLYFVERTPDQQEGDLHLMPALGGPARPIAKGVLSPAAVSPDESKIAFLRIRERAQLSWDVVIANADGSEERIAHSRVPPQFYRHSYRLSWSPDGKSVAVPTGDARGEKAELVAIDVATGEERLLTKYQWPQGNLGDAIWLPDGSGLIVQARQRDENMQLWHVAVPSGDTRRITSGATDHYSVSLTADGKSIATTQYNPSTTIWVSNYSDPSRAHQVTFSPKATDGLPGWPRGLSWVGNDKLVFSSRQSGNPDLWLLHVKSGERRQLTNHPGQDWFPASSPDGKYIYYVSGRSGQANIWRMEADGTNPQQVTNSLAYDPNISPDGKTLTFETLVNGRIRAVRMPTAGGKIESLLEAEAGGAAYSFDGKKIMIGSAAGNAVIIDAHSGRRLQTIAGEHWSWTPDGTGLIFFGKHNGENNLMVRPLDERRAPYPLTTLSNARVQGFAISPDGKRLAVLRVEEEADAVLITDFR